ncbi:GNAT family N-acetyltransferase [Duganella sp. FT94W]|uniref:GNAT family N-acetyltransferase n=1 Tax=Duganella lactea TaxID=2692173 RepID=A0ABW9V456_9BURK|nr:GNAT family N-acetyltransferase [Duganella lactea]MYM33562.1 GNAT family N-acetyltransferase [Duganella lactea]
MKRISNGLEEISHDQTGTLFRLFQLYYYENSDWMAEEIGDDGLFDACAVSIADYVTSPSKRAYWIRKDGALAGFVVTEPVSLPDGREVDELADLFIMKRYRRQGVALAAVRELASRFERPWLVAVFRNDTRAAAFWHKAFQELDLASVRPYTDPELEQFRLYAMNDRQLAQDT